MLWHLRRNGLRSFIMMSLLMMERILLSFQCSTATIPYKAYDTQTAGYLDRMIACRQFLLHGRGKSALQNSCTGATSCVASLRASPVVL